MTYPYPKKKAPLKVCFGMISKYVFLDEKVWFNWVQGYHLCPLWLVLSCYCYWYWMKEEWCGGSLSVSLESWWQMLCKIRPGVWKLEAWSIHKKRPYLITFLSPIIGGGGIESMPFTTFLVNMWDATVRLKSGVLITIIICTYWALFSIETVPFLCLFMF